ncbi:MAG: choice-of-anchor J domain-containing protein, partial [Muribaculaceae bacterium]|nr:choice-of-anchor J domain-containing protein [Muribaculaceae bacterium]
MKKLSLLVLIMALLMPLSISAKSVNATKLTNKVKVATITDKSTAATFAKRGDAFTHKSTTTPNVATLKAVAPKGTVMTWDFEDADAGISDFTLVDNDGDGYNWYYHSNVGLETGRYDCHSGDGNVSSESYSNDESKVLYPDNWLISPQVELGGALKFFAEGQDASYCEEVFGVYVCVGDEPVIANFVQVGADKTATEDYEEYEFDLSAYAGKTGYFAIVHHNVYDMFILNIDDITFDPQAVVTPEPTIPLNVEVDPTATTGKVTWEPGEHNGSWDLRYREYVDPATTNKLWDFPLDSYSEQIDGWMSYDADGDGSGWGFAYSSSAQDDVCLASYSYENYTSLDPDNWIFTPEVPMGGKLTFKCKNVTSSYPDKIKVYLTTDPEWDSVDDFEEISEFIQPGEEWEDYEIDLSTYQGTGWIAFRHYDSYDNYAIYLDDIAVSFPGANEIPDWTVKEDVENPYTIEGLTPETEYEVQVMAYNDEGDKWSDWTKSTNFTTLAAEQEGPETMYLVGTMTNNWDIENPEAMTKDEEDGVFTITKEFVVGDEMKFVITPGSWDDANVFGAEANGAFELSEDYIGGQDLALAQPGQNFKVMVAGEYEVVVDPVNMKAYFTKTEAPVVDELYIIGNFTGENGWDLEAAEAMTLDEETGKFSITKEFEANAEFKLIAAKNWDDNTTFGGEDNENAGFFLVDPYLGGDITMVNPGANFKIEAAGEYEIVADKENKVLVVTGINIPVTEIEVSIESDPIVLDLGGDTYQIDAKALPETATNKKLLYESSDEGVLTVDENGLVTAVKSGTWSVLNRAPKVTAVEPANASITVESDDNDDVRVGINFTVLNPTGVRNINATKTVASKKFVNAAGMVSDKPFDGLNIIVTTYGDGSRSIEK